MCVCFVFCVGVGVVVGVVVGVGVGVYSLKMQYFGENMRMSILLTKKKGPQACKI
jgi:hypothetical protein